MRKATIIEYYNRIKNHLHELEEAGNVIYGHQKKRALLCRL